MSKMLAVMAASNCGSPTVVKNPKSSTPVTWPSCTRTLAGIRSPCSTAVRPVTGSARRRPATVDTSASRFSTRSCSSSGAAWKRRSTRSASEAAKVLFPSNGRSPGRIGRAARSGETGTWPGSRGCLPAGGPRRRRFAAGADVVGPPTADRAVWIRSKWSARRLRAAPLSGASRRAALRQPGPSRTGSAPQGPRESGRARSSRRFRRRDRRRCLPCLIRARLPAPSRDVEAAAMHGRPRSQRTSPAATRCTKVHQRKGPRPMAEVQPVNNHATHLSTVTRLTTWWS